MDNEIMFFFHFGKSLTLKYKGLLLYYFEKSIIVKEKIYRN